MLFFSLSIAVAYFSYFHYLVHIWDVIWDVSVSLQVFLSVRSPGPAHEEAHLRAKQRRSGREERGRGGRRGGAIERWREGRAVELPAAHRIHPVNKSACREAHPYERVVKIQHTDRPSHWRRGLTENEE